MLSEAKHLKSFSANEILRCAQDDKHRPKESWDRLLVRSHAERGNEGLQIPSSCLTA